MVPLPSSNFHQPTKPDGKEEEIVRVVEPLIEPEVARIVVLPVSHACRQPCTGNRRRGCIRRTPGHRTRQVLGAVIAIGSRGSELLRSTLGNRSVCRSHCDRHQRRRHREVRRATDRARGRSNRRAARGHARGQPRTGNRRGRCIRRTPGHRTRQVLGAVIAIGSRGSELLRGALGNRRDSPASRQSRPVPAPSP